MATPAEERWCFPRLWCPVCQRGCETVEDLIAHQLSRRPWQQTTPEALCARLVAKAPAVDPAQAQQLRAALEAAEARRPRGA
jgi:hypothetical protein